MPESPHPDLASQFRELGDQLRQMLQVAWESDDAQKLRQELRHGLDELGKVTSEAVDEFQASDAGQRLKSEAQDFKARVERGEVEAKAREEISKVLAFMNAELEQFNNQWRKPETSASTEDEQA